MSQHPTSSKMVLSLPPYSFDAKIIETRHVKDVIPLVDEDTWFLIDLDNCTFQGMQALGHLHWFEDLLQQHLEKGMTEREAVDLIYPDWIKTQQPGRVQPLEEAFIPTLSMLQNRGVVVMGLTHRQPSLSEISIRQVTSLGLDLTKTAPTQDSFIVPPKMPTLYSQGILFVGDQNKKSDVFTSFLTQINQKPKKVIFMDDKRHNVEDLKILTTLGIEYTGIHYTAILHVEPIYDRKIAEFQYKYLHRIMNNETASMLMEKNFE